jgi:hypothetical protein
VCGRERLVARLDGARAGDEREVLAADPPAPDVEDRPLAVPELRRGELVGLEDRDDAIDAVGALEVEAGDVLEIADRADDRHLLAPARVRPRADRLDPGDDGRHLVLGGRRLHHDHHGLRVPFGGSA